MDDNQNALEDERAIELSSIQAIFPELTLDADDPFRASLEISVNPEKALKVSFQAPVQTVPIAVPSKTISSILEQQKAVPIVAAPVTAHELLHLPPLSVSLVLPTSYPSSEPPQVELASSPRWIPKSVLRTLAQDCERLWKEVGQDQVIYTYIDHLQQSAEAAFGLGVGESNQFELPDDLKISLLDFDIRKRKEELGRKTFECGICLEPKKGTQCHQLSLCGHVFCVSCLQDFYNNAIIEGDVDSIKCLAPDCGKGEPQQTPDGFRRKHNRTLNPGELLQIPIEQEKVQRYVELKRKKKLEADKNTIYCPRQWCQGAARSKKHPKPVDPFGDFEESESDPDNAQQNQTNPSADDLGGKKKKKRKIPEIPMSERLSVCEDCGFAFCAVCNMGWHGELAFCNPRRQAELDEEEKATLAYLKAFSARCPTCNAPAQKTMGCNHMICSQCRTHFCYLCSAYLMSENPYEHFNNFKSTCYMRLWELEEGDGADIRGAPAGQPVNIEVLDDEFATESESDDEDDLPEVIEVAEAGNGHNDNLNDQAAAAHDHAERNMHIEIINFAGNGINQRIQMPDPLNRAIPPAAPNPPQRGPRIQQRNQRGGGNAAQDRNVNHIPRAHNIPQNQPAGYRGEGGAAHQPDALRRFLALALNDQEDEWDSDELDDDDFNDPRPVR